MAKKRYVIVLGDKTTGCGQVTSAWGQDGPAKADIEGIPIVCVGDYAICARHKGVHRILEQSIPYLGTLGGRHLALEGFYLSCGCQLVSSQRLVYYTDESEDKARVAKATASAAPVTAKGIQTASATPGISAEEVRMLSAQTDKQLELDYNIQLKSGGNRTLTPLEIPNFSELSSGTTRNTEKVDFHIINRKDPADSVTLEVLDGDKVIYTEPDTSALLPSGKHLWQWDGYDTSGVLDTSVLKSRDLMVRLTATQNSNQLILEFNLRNKADKVDWVDARVDRNAKTVEITVRPSFPSYEVSDGSIPGYTPKTYTELLKMAKDGIEKYWTRDGSREVNGTPINAPIQTAKGVFNVNVKADINVEPSAEGFKLKVLLKERFTLGPYRPDDSTSLSGQSQLVHKAYFWIKERKHSAQDADADFEYVAAHEFGHRIMGAYGGRPYSWSHNNTSTELLQTKLKGTSHPKTGEIDLMKYAEIEVSSRDQWLRKVASEQDVKGLLWLTKVLFKE